MEKTKNENCLEGMRCPKCKSIEPFNIRVTCTSKVYDNGTEEEYDFEWGPSSKCACDNCGHAGKVKDFYYSGEKK